MVSSSDLRELEGRLIRATATRDSLVLEHAKAEKDLEAAKTRLEAVVKAQVLIQTVAKSMQDQVKFHVEGLVQTALDTIFPTVYVFRTSFELRRGQTEMDIWVDKDGEILDPVDAAGGGVVDIITFALRVVAWSLSKTSPVLILDEPFKWLSAGLRPVAGELLRGLADRLGLQIIMVTHDPEYVEKADRIFVVEQKLRRSRVTCKEGTK